MVQYFPKRNCKTNAESVVCNNIHAYKLPYAILNTGSKIFSIYKK